MPDVHESQVFAALLKYRIEGEVSNENVQVTVRLRPIDNHAGDSPDFLLWAEMEFDLFGQRVKLSVPIPVEAEKGGISGGAIHDLKKFVERRKHVAEIPMVVVSEAGYASKQQVEQLTAKFTISQVPVRRI
jgi:hypothetical protein